MKKNGSYFTCLSVKNVVPRTQYVLSLERRTTAIRLSFYVASTFETKFFSFEGTAPGELWGGWQSRFFYSKFSVWSYSLSFEPLQQSLRKFQVPYNIKSNYSYIRQGVVLYWIKDTYSVSLASLSSRLSQQASFPYWISDCRIQSKNYISCFLVISFPEDIRKCVPHCLTDDIETFWVKWEWYPDRRSFERN